jgi:hypothetical protein
VLNGCPAAASPPDRCLIEHSSTDVRPLFDRCLTGP